MAKLEKELWNDFDELLDTIQNGILNGSISATLVDSSNFFEENARCSVRVFERYSAMRGNRISLNVTLFQSGEGPIKVSAITSGGSRAVFYKWNTIGEESFLECLREIIE